MLLETISKALARPLRSLVASQLFWPRAERPARRILAKLTSDSAGDERRGRSSSRRGGFWPGILRLTGEFFRWQLGQSKHLDWKGGAKGASTLFGVVSTRRRRRCRCWRWLQCWLLRCAFRSLFSAVSKLVRPCVFVYACVCVCVDVCMGLSLYFGAF